ncbi:hypothetical protein OG402_33700 [Streptomyces anulatus]|uniref:hypothetical protein n=1 Tax=Streptomyces anulatus TaxID=1892 RepID=UPI00224D1C71|nr:hypothetical protein [Streptomyces anulatus]MCX4605423.1 hypothetical protein [Streptomyces anulatus]
MNPRRDPRQRGELGTPREAAADQWLAAIRDIPAAPDNQAGTDLDVARRCEHIWDTPANNAPREGR